MSVVSSDVPHSIFPLSVDGLGEVRIAVHAERGRRGAAHHRRPPHRAEERPGRAAARRVRGAAAGDRLPLPRPRPARARDDAHLARQRGRQRRRRRQRVDGVPRRRACSASSSPTCCSASFPTFDEGQKSKTKAALVSTATLARQAERLRLGDHLLLGRGEEKTGGRRKQALLADGYEALIAAIYLDGGIEHARAFIVARVRAAARRGAARRRRRRRTTSRRCRSCCSRAICRCPSTASSARSAPITASCSRSKSWCAASRSRRRPGRARRKRSRKRRARRSTSSRPARLASPRH